MESPYREPKPLKEVIPPDRRRQRAALLVVASMIAGATLFQLVRWMLETRGLPAETPTTPGSLGTTYNRIAPMTLRGPDGAVTLPTGEKMVVHVWLQGCQDCMPAFEAMKQLEESGGIGVRARVVNIAYGEADPSWALRYGVRQNLVFDTGGASIVRPLGISTFTTLVIDRDGTIIHRDRPDRSGYVERMRRAVGTTYEPKLPPPVGESGSLTAEEVQRVVAAHRAAVKQVCWERHTDAPGSSKVTLSLVVGANGDVVSAAASGNDALIASCVEAQARAWQFPAHGERSATIQIPFVFVRE